MTDPTELPPAPPPTTPTTPPAAAVTAAPARRSRTGLIVGLTLGGTALLAVILAAVVGGAVALSTRIADQIEQSAPRDGDESGAEVPDEPEPILEGEPGSPVAVDPLDCDDCFTALATRDLPLAEEDYADVGLTVSDEQWGSDSAAREHRVSLGDWRDSEGTPDACFALYTIGPVPPTTEDVDSADTADTIYYAPYHSSEDEASGMTEAIRVFESSRAAAAHLEAVNASIAECPQYSAAGDGYAAVVSAAAALEVPDDVAAVGWVEESGPFRYYGMDLVRGNLVVRLTLSTGPAVTEADFRGLAEAYARNLGDLPVD